MATDLQDTRPPFESNGHSRALFVAKIGLARKAEAMTTYPPLRGAAREPALDRELAPYPLPAPAVVTTDRAGAWAAADVVARCCTDVVALAARLRIFAKFGIAPSPPASMHVTVMHIMHITV